MYKHFYAVCIYPKLSCSSAALACRGNLKKKTKQKPTNKPKQLFSSIQISFHELALHFNALCLCPNFLSSFCMAVFLGLNGSRTKKGKNNIAKRELKV